jgi:hypothetical protein
MCTANPSLPVISLQERKNTFVVQVLEHDFQYNNCLAHVAQVLFYGGHQLMLYKLYIVSETVYGVSEILYGFPLQNLKKSCRQKLLLKISEMRTE